MRTVSAQIQAGNTGIGQRRVPDLGFLSLSLCLAFHMSIFCSRYLFVPRVNATERELSTGSAILPPQHRAAPDHRHGPEPLRRLVHRHVAVLAGQRRHAADAREEPALAQPSVLAWISQTACGFTASNVNGNLSINTERSIWGDYQIH